MSSGSGVTMLICDISLSPVTFDIVTTAFPFIGVKCDPPENSEMAGSHMTLKEVTFEDTGSNLSPIQHQHQFIIGGSSHLYYLGLKLTTAYAA